jgi:hypothetical protein
MAAAENACNGLRCAVSVLVAWWVCDATSRLGAVDLLIIGLLLSWDRKLCVYVQQQQTLLLAPYQPHF